MIINLTDEELALVKQSVESVDWSYAGHQNTAQSVLRKVRDAARAVSAQRESRAGGTLSVEQVAQIWKGKRDA